MKADGDAALDRLRSARRRNRVARLDRFEAFYKAYVTGLFAVLAIYGAGALIGDDKIVGTGLAHVRVDGPAFLGGAIALAVAIGLRSGGRGGPLALEQADVRHVLLSPVERRVSVRAPAARQLRHSTFLGAAIGGAAGLVAFRRLPETPVEWVLCGSVFGACVAAMSYGVALIAGGLRWPRWLTDLLAVLVLVWAGCDAWFSSTTSPSSWLGEVALWPLRFAPLGLAGVAVASLLVVAGLYVIPGWSVEAAERRSRLVGQLRFAATLQDVRTVMVLQRQLAQEHLRTRPWLRLPAQGHSLTKNGQPRLRVFVHRSLHSMLRWPAFRYVRLLVLAAVAGGSVCAAWAGTAPLLLVSGLALWLIGLDLLEPLAQDADHPDRLDSVAHETGRLWSRHLIVPGVVLLLTVNVAAVPALVLGDTDVVGALFLPTVVLATMMALGGAALVVTRPPTMGASGFVQAPEAAGLLTLWRLLMPPGLAVAAFVPLLVARRSWELHHDVDRMLHNMNTIWYVEIALATWSVLWVRFGGEMRRSLETAGAKATHGKETRKL